MTSVWTCGAFGKIEQINLLVGPSLLVNKPGQRGVYTTGPEKVGRMIGKYTGVLQTLADIAKVGGSVK